MEIKRLEWDSNLFGYEVGKISIESDGINLNDVLLGHDDFKLIYVESDVPIATKELGPCYAKITYSKKVEGDKIVEVNNRNLMIEQYSENITDQLLNLTYQSGVYSRFKLDENFNNKEYKKLYKKWIENSLNGKIADIVEVVKDDSYKILGFVTLKFQSNYSKIGLLAVDTNVRGLGIGSLLLNVVSKFTTNKGRNKIFVSTQKDNKLACKLYEKNGFKKMKTKYIYHWWTNK